VTTQRVLVVGGGPAGMTAALALRRRGSAVVLVEESPDWRPAGVGLLLQSPPLRALAALGLVDDCVAWGHPHETVHLADAAGAEFGVITPPNVVGPGVPASLAMSRTALHGVLAAAVRAAGVAVRLGTTVTALADRAGGGVVAVLADGTELDADLVVAADGLHSATRARAFPDAPEPRPTGQLSWRVEVPRPPDLDRYLMLHGPGVKVGLVPMSADRMYLWVLSSGERPAPGERRDALRRTVAPFGGPVPELLAAVPGDDAVDVRGLSALLVPPPWHRGRIVLVGDAAHTTTPHLAFGVGLAVEDGLVLAEELDRGDDVDAALAAYAARRFERCRLVVETSLQLGEWEQHPEPGMDPPGLTGAAFAALAEPI
jgi:naringenin degradation protein FdeE